MEEILLVVLVLGLIYTFFKNVFKIIYSFIYTVFSIFLVGYLKLILNVPISSGIIFCFAFKYMYRYLFGKIQLSIKAYRKHRQQDECLELRKLVRALFECNYILFIITCFGFLSYKIFNYSTGYALVYIIKIYIILIVGSIIKKMLDRLPKINGFY